MKPAFHSPTGTAESSAPLAGAGLRAALMAGEKTIPALGTVEVAHGPASC